MNPPYVFLDQNHWIYLAKAFWGRPHAPGHVDALQCLASKTASDDVRLPLFDVHLMEHGNAEDAERRDRLAEVFDIFARGWFAAAWRDILPTEIARAIALTFAETNVPFLPPVFGKGFLFSAGPAGRASIPLDWSDADLARLDQWAESPGGLHEFLTIPQESGRVATKQGFADLGERNARAAEQLRAARRPFPKAVHRGAQHVDYFSDLRSEIVTALNSIGRDFDAFLALGREVLGRFWSLVPTIHVDCELTLYRDRQWSRRVKTNDFFDIAQLVTAIPYCTVVVVERFWARAIQETGLAKKYGTMVCSDLAELPAALEAHRNANEKA